MITSQADYSVLPTPERDVLGEGPWWSVADQSLIWVDIWGRKVRRSRLDGTGYAEWAMPSDVGFAIPRADGLVAVGLADGLAWLDTASGVLTESDLGPDLPPGHRLNDGKCDRAGRLWFGSIREDGVGATAALYCYDGLGLDLVLGQVTVSNGLAWNPAGDCMYYVDSPTRQISAYDYNLAAGTINRRTVFAEDEPSPTPDGLTVDAEGFVWSPKWDGGTIIRYAPDGTPVLSLRVPVLRPTSCMFVGRNLDVLAVTTARSDADDARGQDLAGAVLLIPTQTSGIPELAIRDPQLKNHTAPDPRNS